MVFRVPCFGDHPDPFTIFVSHPVVPIQQVWMDPRTTGSIQEPLDIYMYINIYTLCCFSRSTPLSPLLWFDFTVLLLLKTKDFLHTHIPTYALNRKSETYVPLNILLGIHQALSRYLHVRTRTKGQIREKYTYFYVKKLPRKKSYANKVL